MTYLLPILSLSKGGITSEIFGLAIKKLLILLLLIILVTGGYEYSVAFPNKDC